MRQKNQVELNFGTGTRGEAPKSQGVLVGPSMEAVVERENLRKALARVKRNKGAAGVDGMSVDGLSAYLKEHCPAIRVQLLEASYKPQPVRRVEIPKASGGMRPL